MRAGIDKERRRRKLVRGAANGRARSAFKSQSSFLWARSSLEAAAARYNTVLGAGAAAAANTRCNGPFESSRRLCEQRVLRVAASSARRSPVWALRACSCGPQRLACERERAGPSESNSANWRTPFSCRTGSRRRRLAHRSRSRAEAGAGAEARRRRTKHRPTRVDLNSRLARFANGNSGQNSRFCSSCLSAVALSTTVVAGSSSPLKLHTHHQRQPRCLSRSAAASSLLVCAPQSVCARRKCPATPTGSTAAQQTPEGSGEERTLSAMFAVVCPSERAARCFQPTAASW